MADELDLGLTDGSGGGDGPGRDARRTAHRDGLEGPEHVAQGGPGEVAHGRPGEMAHGGPGEEKPGR